MKDFLPILFYRFLVVAYDANGNTAAEGSTAITYNLLNLPQTVQLPAGRSIQNTYAADGRKLKTITAENGEYTDGTKIYNGNLVFDKNGELEYILLSEGRILHNNGSFTFEYHLKDHLGSTRVAFLADSIKTVVQENAYYPFGAPIANLSWSTGDNRYKREGKEYISDFDWNKYDYAARYYDPYVARFLHTDPMAGNYYSISPYVFVAGNPINMIDPTGMFYDWYEAENGKITWTDFTSQKELDENNIKGKYLGETVVQFIGSKDEQLGKDDNLFGEGAILADVTVYGYRGADDISYYKGFTMSSDPSKFGVVADGDYTVNRLNAGEPLGPYSSDLVLGNRYTSKIPAKDGTNPAHTERNPGYLTGVFIHRSNNDGWAGTYIKNKQWKGVSEGCLLIVPNQWNAFTSQLYPQNSFLLQLRRK